MEVEQGPEIRNQIRIRNLEPDPDTEKNGTPKVKQIINNLKSWMAGGFSCCLNSFLETLDKSQSLFIKKYSCTRTVAFL